MDAGLIDGVILSPAGVINVPGGDVLHVMKCEDTGYQSFGEAYFSIIEPGIVKAWKRHHLMTLNIVVPVGEIRFIMFDDRCGSSSYGLYQNVTLSRSKYARLTIPPMIWMGFQGASEDSSMLLNIADIQHSSQEVDRKSVDEIDFDWSLGK